MTTEVWIKPLYEDSQLPEYKSELAAGADCYAHLDRDQGGEVIAPGQRVLIRLGFSVALQPGYEMQLRPRSGLALKHGISMVNTPGTIDADYRGEVMALLINHGEELYTVGHGDRVCQAVISRIPAVTFLETSELPSTEREGGGFGHTGT